VRVLGLDPGSRVTGWGVVEGAARRPHVCGFGCLRLPRRQGRAQALSAAAGGVADLLADFAPDVVVVETPFAARYPASALALAEVRGAVLAELGRWGGEVREYEPARVKSVIVGHGRAEKRQVAFMVQRQLGLGAAPPHDAADALALALCFMLLDASERGVLASSSAVLA
jgi:crossover junction endodeoxyribonuclease RuvC